MIVTGGIYQERCRFPKWDRIFGSGLRAAFAISQLSPGSELHSYVARDLEGDVAATLAWSGIRGRLQPSQPIITFEYLHPFERLGWTGWTPPEELPQSPPLSVEGNVVLRFGMMEGSARVAAHRAVYDPQSPHPISFSFNGSRAGELVIIATDEEVVRLSGETLPHGARPDRNMITKAMIDLFDSDTSLCAVLLKDPLGSLTLYQGDEGKAVRNYAAESYFRIGAGDILAAAFAHAWGERCMSIAGAAEFASRSLAYAVQGPRLPLDRAGIDALQPAPDKALRTLRIVGGRPFELQVLALHTSGWIETLAGKAILDPDGTAPGLPEEPHATIVLIGESTGDAEIRRLSEGVAPTSTVVYWPLGDPEIVERYFPGAVFTRDYSTALYRAMRFAPT